LNDIIRRIDETERSPVNLLGADWPYVIDRAIGQLRKRLSLVVPTGGGHIEHRFD